MSELTTITVEVIPDEAIGVTQFPVDLNRTTAGKSRDALEYCRRSWLFELEEQLSMETLTSLEKLETEGCAKLKRYRGWSTQQIFGAIVSKRVKLTHFSFPFVAI